MHTVSAMGRRLLFPPILALLFERSSRRMVRELEKARAFRVSDRVASSKINLKQLFSPGTCKQ